MRAFADCAESVQGRDAERRSEIAVGTATDSGLFETPTKFVCEPRSFPVKSSNCRCALHRWTIQAAGDLDLALAVKRPKRNELPASTFRVLFRSDPQIEDRARLGGDNINASATSDLAGVDRSPALQVDHFRQPQNLAREFNHRAVSFFEVEPGVCGNAFHVQCVLADPFTRRLDRAGWASGRFEHENGFGVPRQFLCDLS